MVGMLAAAGALDQIGRVHGRAWGEIDDPAVLARVEAHLRAGAAVGGLQGTTFGRIGGRPMGMYTAVSNTDQWMRQFGVDVEEIDQWELVRRSETVDAESRPRGPRVARAARGGRALRRRAADPELLERQIRSYHAMRELIEEWNLDFCGIKAQPELTDNFCTMDVTEAFLNDPYDWDGPKEPIVCSTEADMDAALTMQILKRLRGDAGALRRRAPLPRGSRRSGISATPASTPPGSPRAATTRRRTCAGSTSTRRSSTSRPAAPPSTTWPPRASSRSRG